jgi:hypothetical protein
LPGARCRLPHHGGFPQSEGSRPPHDAYQVRKLREAVVLAKSNMAEFAVSPFETVGSLLRGYTRNPYALDHVPAGNAAKFHCFRGAVSLWSPRVHAATPECSGRAWRAAVEPVPRGPARARATIVVVPRHQKI